MKKTLLLCAIVAAACASPHPPAPVTPPASSTPPAAADTEALIARFESTLSPLHPVAGEDDHHDLAERMAALNIRGLSVAVIEDYEIRWARAYGLADVDGGVEATVDTRFLAGSISKSVNALGQLLADADGTLSLDQPVNELLTSWQLPDNELTADSPVTIRKLLSHTAGTTVHGFRGYAPGEEVPTTVQILDGEAPANSAPVRVDLAPGTEFRYSGGGTTISQLALVDRSGKPYPEVMAEQVLVPLGMRSSSFDQNLAGERLARAAVGYDSSGERIEGGRFAYPEMAAAGLWTTPSDLARFFLAIARARAGRPSPVSRHVAVEMTTPVIAADGAGVGLGVFVGDLNGTKFFGHGGSDVGFQSTARVSLDGGYGVVIMANSDNGFQIFDEVEDAILAAHGWAGAREPITRARLDAGQLDAFTGVYLNPDGAPRTVRRQGDRLELVVPFEEPVELVPVSEDVVIDRSQGERLARAEDGSLTLGPPEGGSAADRLTPLEPGETHYLLELEAGRYAQAAAAWRAAVEADAELARPSEQRANRIGYTVLRDDPQRAVEIFRVITEVFPDSANAWDSLGEGYMEAGRIDEAIAAYETALARLDDDPRLADEAAAERLRAGSTAQLEKLRAMRQEPE